MKIFKYFIAGFLFFSSLNLHAQVEIDKLFNMSFSDLLNAEITTATGTPVSLKQAPAVASVITKEMLEASGATTLDEALELVPGIHVLPSGLKFLSPSISIRGILTGTNPNVLLLINGFSSQELHNSVRPIHMKIPLSIISRIEIIKGPGSAIHGADSFAGIVNVITKKGSEIDGTKAGFKGGSFDTYSAWVEHGKKYGDWDFAFGIEAMKTEGDDDRIVEQDYMHTIGLGAFSEAPGPLSTAHEGIGGHLGLKNENFDIRLFYSSWEADFGHSGTHVIHKGTYGKFDHFSAIICYDKKEILENLDLKLKLSGAYLNSDAYFDFFPKNFLNMIGNPIREDRYGGIEVIGFYNGIDNHNIRISSGMNNYDMKTDQYKNFGPGVPVQFGPLVRMKNTPYIFLEDQNRDLWFITLQDEWEIADAFDLTAGVRYDEYSDFGSTTNPRVALVWETTDKLMTKLLYGEAFRAPSFGEQHYINNPVALGNPKLDPEEIGTLEVVFDYHWTPRFRTNLALFNYNIEGLIEYVQDPGLTTKTAQNNKDQDGYGFELEAEWNASEVLQLKANTAFQRSKDKDTDEIVPDAPETQFQAKINWNFGYNWFFNTTYTFIGSRNRADGDLRDDIDDYDYVDLTLRKNKVLNNFDFSLSIKNLFDEDRREPSDGRIPNDFPLEGRSIWGEVRYSI